jgi:UDP-N-acetylglucosamine 2-epimerase (non-hydrolysing)
MPYTERSRQNLIAEGIPGNRIYVTGNPINEVIRHYEAQISGSDILQRLELESAAYFLVTMHRAENVDLEDRLRDLTSSLVQLHEAYEVPVIMSTHPRTRVRMESFGVDIAREDIRFLEPFGFFDFIMLERNALCLLSDSGTVQEECCLFKVPNVTIRDVTERPETVECGSNILSGADPEIIRRCVSHVLEQKGRWEPPAEYQREDVSDTAVRILLGYCHQPMK